MSTQTDQRDLAAEVEDIRKRHSSTVIHGWGDEDVETLLAALDAAQREIQQLQSWSESWHNALDTAAVVVEASPNGSPTEIVESIRARFESLKAEHAERIAEHEQSARSEVESIKAQLREQTSARIEAQREIQLLKEWVSELREAGSKYIERIAQLERVPEERKEISTLVLETRSHAKNLGVNLDSHQLLCATETLLQDAARYRNAHSVLMAERQELEHALQLANDNSIRFQQRAEHLERAKQLISDEGAQRSRDLATVMHERNVIRERVERLESANNALSKHAAAMSDCAPLDAPHVSQSN